MHEPLKGRLQAQDRESVVTPKHISVRLQPPETAVQRQQEREQMGRELGRFLSPPMTAQRQAAQPVLQASSLYTQEVQRLWDQLGAVQRQLDAVPPLPGDALEQALQRQREQAAPVGAPRQPRTPGEWVTVMRAQAEQVDGKWLRNRESAQFSGLQRQVAQTLAQSFRQDRQPPEVRHAQYGEHLAALQRHPLSAPVGRVALTLVPPAERVALQRAMDEVLQREREEQAQDEQALRVQSLQRQRAELEAEAERPVFERIQARRGAGSPLPDAVRRHLEQGLNHDLSRVRIHDDAEADKLAKGVSALAFTTGTDIFFRSGNFRPNTRSGLELLAHEVTHTVQQAQGRVGRGVDPDTGLEAEARTMGARLAHWPLAKGGVKGKTRLAPLTAGRVLQRQRGAAVVGDAKDVANLQKRLKSLNADMVLTMAQAAADVAGIADPTPISDGISAAISLYRGDFLGAGLSVVSMVPGLGDAIAKPIKGTKLGTKIVKLEAEIRAVTAELAKLTGKPLRAAEVAASASRRVVTQEVLKRLPKNWPQVRGVIGMPYKKASLPPQYAERTVNGKKTITRKAGQADDDLVAPLGIDSRGKVYLKQGSNRISDPALMRRNYAAMHGKLPTGHQVHHLVPDNLVRDHPLGQAAQRAGVSLDRGENLMGLPGKTAYNPGDTGHWSSHPDYDAVVRLTLDTAQKQFERTYGSLDAVPPDKLREVMDEIADDLRDLIKRSQLKLKGGRLASAPTDEVRENLA